jgi:hypothetical protein
LWKSVWDCSHHCGCLRPAVCQQWLHVVAFPCNPCANTVCYDQWLRCLFRSPGKTSNGRPVSNPSSLEQSTQLSSCLLHCNASALKNVSFQPLNGRTSTAAFGAASAAVSRSPMHVVLVCTAPSCPERSSQKIFVYASPNAAEWRGPGRTCDLSPCA